MKGCYEAASVATSGRSSTFRGGSDHHRAAQHKVDVTRADHYEPELQRSLRGVRCHCCDGIIPARPCRPKDKRVVEVGVKCVKGNFLSAGALRDLTGLNRQVRFWTLDHHSRFVAAYINWVYQPNGALISA